jgi:chemotaxis signal transduction protein
MEPSLTLLCRAGEVRFLLPAASVTRVLGAAAFVRLSGLPNAACGVVNVAGENLVVVDARALFLEPSAPLSPEQRFVLFHAPRGWVLWVDEVLGVREVHRWQRDALEVEPESIVRFAVRLDRESLPLLDVDAVAPGELVKRGDADVSALEAS